MSISSRCTDQDWLPDTRSPTDSKGPSPSILRHTEVVQLEEDGTVGTYTGTTVLIPYLLPTN